MSGIPIQALTPDDWSAARAIYSEGIASGNSTFEKTAPEWDAWDRGHLRIGRLAAKVEGELLGWAALSPVSSRCVYAGVAEVSVYVSGRAQRRGVGRALLSSLIQVSEREGLWTLQAGIFPENTPSIELFTRHGFRTVGLREKLGCMDGRWRDVALLERRSPVTGR